MTKANNKRLKEIIDMSPGYSFFEEARFIYTEGYYDGKDDEKKNIIKLLENIRPNICYHESNPCTTKDIKNKYPLNKPCISCDRIFYIIEKLNNK